ncbi:MAG: hypothetical protein AB7V46_12435 [Thermomicrobiales bacterium]
MTKTEFIDRWKHELAGMVLDAMLHRHGAEAAIFARNSMRKIDERLGQMFDQLNPPAEVPAKPQLRAAK